MNDVFEKCVIMVTEHVQIPHRRSIYNLDDSRGLQDREISELCWKRIKLAVMERPTQMNVPLAKGLVSLCFMKGNIPKHNEIISHLFIFVDEITCEGLIPVSESQFL